MERRTIPNTDLRVSSICLGTMTFGTPVGEKDAIRLTQRALALGINFLDTANMYEGYRRYIGSPGGVAEEIIGKALKGKRASVTLATKVGMKIGPAQDDQGLGRNHILREIDRSLKRLESDYVDLYYMHKPDPDTPLAESVETFNSLIEAGKIRYWGISNFSAEQIKSLLEVCDQNDWRRPVAIQPPYSLLKREVEIEILPLCEKEQIAVIPYQVLQGGLLSGKYKRGAPIPPNSRQAEKPEWIMKPTDEVFEQLSLIEAEAKSKNRTLLQHALLSLLEKPIVASLIIGVKRLHQLESAIQALL